MIVNERLHDITERDGIMSPWIASHTHTRRHRRLRHRYAVTLTLTDGLHYTCATKLKIDRNLVKTFYTNIHATCKLPKLRRGRPIYMLNCPSSMVIPLP